jgi:hypothetical protein
VSEIVEDLNVVFHRNCEIGHTVVVVVADGASDSLPRDCETGLLRSDLLRRSCSGDAVYVDGVLATAQGDNRFTAIAFYIEDAGPCS